MKLRHRTHIPYTQVPKLLKFHHQDIRKAIITLKTYS